MRLSIGRNSGASGCNASDIRSKKDGSEEPPSCLAQWLSAPIRQINNGPKISEITAINFNRMFSDGPDVSLNGSPTVSPVTAAA